MAVIDGLEKLRLCITEMHYCKVILSNTTQVDEWCAHLLAIYITIRMDDFTKIAGKYIPKADDKREYFTDLLNKYNDGYRSVRDKLGAHFQRPDENKPITEPDITKRLEIYCTLEYEQIIVLVDLAQTLFEIIRDDEGVSADTEQLSTTDNMTIIDHCGKVYMDDVAHLGVDAFAIGGKNTGIMMTCSKAQGKAQLIKSLQLMTQTARDFYQLPLEASSVKRMFKRLYVCTLVNYYDNLVTRNIDESADQYDIGFDKMIGDLATKYQPKEMLLKFFEDFHQQYNMTPKVKKLRDVRDKACGHLDLTMTADDIDKMLDGATDEAIEEIFVATDNFWEYLLKHVFLLKMLAIPARSKLYGTNFVDIERPKHFYKGEPEAAQREEKKVEELWHDIVKRTEGHDEAWSTLSGYLKNPDDINFIWLTNHLTKRFLQERLSGNEAHIIRSFVMTGKSGNPKEVMAWLLDLFYIYKPKSIRAYHVILLLMTQFAYKDKEGHTDKIIDLLLEKGNYMEQVYGLLMLQNYCVSSHDTIYHPERVTVEDNVVEHIENVRGRIAKLGMLTAMCSYWFSGDYYCHYVKAMPNVTSWLKDEITKATDDYATYIKAGDEMIKELHEIIEMHRFTQLNYVVGNLEEKRGHAKNMFMLNVIFDLIWPVQRDPYEQCYQALNFEMAGNNYHALHYMEWIAKENPLDEGIKKALEDMKGRMEKES